ncbi:MAG: alpha-2,8-polysialyltransferase family protein [Prolixibacteraceae bacterium]|nr:alpha-2,8-polysialyltransferase family protein [Prolixibacteraceae bacterium]
MKDIQLKKRNSINEIIHELEKSDLLFDFFSLIVSEWHLDNLNIFLQQENLTRGVIIITPQSNVNNNTRFRLNKSNFTNRDYSNCEIFVLNEPVSQLNLENYLLRFFRKMHSDNHLFCISPTDVNLKFLSSIPIKYSNINYIIIDEGTGNYRTPFQFRLNTQFKIKNKIQLYLVTYIKSFFMEFIKRNTIRWTRINVTKKLFFLKTVNGLIPNPQISKCLYKYYIDNKVLNINEPNIILFKDLNAWEDSTLIPFYKELLEYLVSLDINIFIKRHPNDTKDWFEQLITPYEKVKIIDYNRSGEQLIADYKPKCIIGGLSTVIFTSPFIYNINTYSFMLKYKLLERAPLKMKKSIDFYYDQFKNSEPHLTFIENFNQIKVSIVR